MVDPKDKRIAELESQLVEAKRSTLEAVIYYANRHLRAPHFADTGALELFRNWLVKQIEAIDAARKDGPHE